MDTRGLVASAARVGREAREANRDRAIGRTREHHARRGYPDRPSRAAVLYGGDRASARGLTNVALPGGANAPASLSSQGRNRSHPPHLSGVETMEPAAGDAQL